MMVIISIGITIILVLLRVVALWKGDRFNPFKLSKLGSSNISQEITQFLWGGCPLNFLTVTSVMLLACVKAVRKPRFRSPGFSLGVSLDSPLVSSRKRSLILTASRYSLVLDHGDVCSDHEGAVSQPPGALRCARLYDNIGMRVDQWADT
jgi:hypothetical protein